MNSELLASPSVSMAIKRDVINTLGTDLFKVDVNLTIPYIFNRGIKFKKKKQSKNFIFENKGKDSKGNKFLITVIINPVIVDKEFHNVLQVTVLISRFDKKGNVVSTQQSSKLYHKSVLKPIINGKNR